MRWDKIISGFGLLLILSLAGAIPGQATQMGTYPEESLSEDDEELLEDEELSEEEVNRLLESYLGQEEDGLGQVKEFIPDSEYQKVRNPKLQMRPEGEKNIRYTLPNGNYFISNIPQGMVSSGPVDLRLPSGAVGIVKKDEGTGSISDSWHFTESGSYQVQILSYQTPGSGGNDYHVYEVLFCFTILSPTDGHVGMIPAPKGFQITKVRLDGEEQPLKSSRGFFLEKDGRYQITYQAQEYPELELETDFVLDTTAPFLSFAPESEDGVYGGPVEFYPSEPDCQIRMNYNGEQGYAIGRELVAAGNYGLTVEDPAGNERWYSLRIRQTYNLMDVRILVLGFIALAGIGIWMAALRRNMKVV